MKGTNSERADDIPLIIHWLKQVVCSYALQQRHLKSLSARLSKAELALEKLAKKTPQDEVALQTKVETILKRYRVTGQFLTSIEKKIRYRKVYQGAGRGSQNRPSLVICEFHWTNFFLNPYFEKA